MFFRLYFETGFDLDAAVNALAASENPDVIQKVRSKAELFLRNIQTDLPKEESRSFGEIKLKFKSKYKNLPQKFHFYLDEIIKHLMKNA